MLSETQLSSKIELFMYRKAAQYPDLRVPTIKFRQAQTVRLAAYRLFGI